MVATHCASFVGTLAIVHTLNRLVPVIFDPYELAMIASPNNKHIEDNSNSYEGIGFTQSTRSKLQLSDFGFHFLPNLTLRKQLYTDVFLLVIGR